MKSKIRIACIAMLLAFAMPAFALQLGEIQVKSALNQPLVAAIPLHPEDLAELDGLKVGLASTADFDRAGLPVTLAVRTLQFHVVTNNNGQKLILVTSSQPITAPYLDFLLQVDTRQGKQIREFVVLLNPVIAAPPPPVQAAPVAPVAPVAPPPTKQPAPPPQRSLEVPPPMSAPPVETGPKPEPVAASPQLEQQPKPQPKPQPAAQSEPQPQPQPAPQPAAQPEPQPQPQPAPQPAAQPESQPALAAQAAGTVNVVRGDTLYGIARQHANDSRGSINRMMLAMKAVNPEAFFKDNINNLKAGAILRIPTRDELDSLSVAEANAEVHRQYEAWRASRAHRATVVEGTAVAAAANAAPEPEGAPASSDHLALVPPSGEGGGTSNRPGVEGGTGSETVVGLQRQLQNGRSTLVSLGQSNSDLESRIESLKNISSKSDKLLSMKDATIAELQQKLGQTPSGELGSATAASTALASVELGGAAVAAAGSAGSAAAAGSAQPGTAAKPARQAATQAWYERPATWIIAGLIVLALILWGLLRRRRGAVQRSASNGPLADPDDIASTQAADEVDDPESQERPIEMPDDPDAHLELCRLYYADGDAEAFVAAAETMHAQVADIDCGQWREVLAMGAELVPHNPLFQAYGGQDAGVGDVDEATASDDDVAETVAEEPLSAPEVHDEPDDAAYAIDVPEPEATAIEPEPAVAASEPDADPDPAFSDDPVDTKLDLARAYLDMGDPVGARAMLEEVIEEGTQVQKDEAKRLLAEASD